MTGLRSVFSGIGQSPSISTSCRRYSPFFASQSAAEKISARHAFCSAATSVAKYSLSIASPGPGCGAGCFGGSAANVDVDRMNRSATGVLMSMRPPRGRHYNHLAVCGAGEDHQDVIITRIWLGMALIGALAARAQDWPQFLGPTRNGVADTKQLADSWPAAGPTILWQKNVGAGWSGPVVSKSKLILFHRVGDKETVECFDAATGKPIWSGDYPTNYRDDFGF